MLYRHSGKQYSFSLTVGASHSCMRITVMLGVRFELISMYMSALYVCGKAFNRCMWPVCDADHDKSHRTSSTDAAYASGRSLRIVLNYSPSIPKPHHPNSLCVEILFLSFHSELQHPTSHIVPISRLECWHKIQSVFYIVII